MSDAPEMLSPRKQPKASRVGIIVLMSVGAALVLFGAAVWWLLTRTENRVPSGQQVEVRIPQGAGTEQIGRMLASYGVINNSLLFDIEAKLQHTPLHPGTYELVTGMPDDVVLKRLAAGPQIDFVDVPIPPGFTAMQIARRFAARTGVDEDEMMSLVSSGAPQFVAGHPYLAYAYGSSLEGYLYPATYRIKKGTRPADIIEMMLQKFDTATAGLDLSYAKSKNLTAGDVVTIASMIEREAKVPKDFPMVASVIYNRLHARMRLQVDATVLYVAPEGTTRLGNADLFIQSPYNTYRHSGLPPGPICSPSIEAIQAAAHPAQTKYLYYVLTGKDGSHTFAVTYKDFLAAVRKYHQVFGQ